MLQSIPSPTPAWQGVPIGEWLVNLMPFLGNDVSIGVSAGEEDWGIFPRSSADFDHGLREMLRRSPRPREVAGYDGDEGVRADLGELLMFVVVRASERSTTDLLHRLRLRRAYFSRH